MIVQARRAFWIGCFAAHVAVTPAVAQVGGPAEPLRYTGEYRVNFDRQDGSLPPVVGVQNIQVLRSNRSHPEWSDGLGWTYHHCPVMVYWNDRFYLASKTNLIDEDVGSGQLLLCTSANGRDWSFPRPIYPLFAKGEDYNVGYRNPWYISPDNRLLCLVGYGANGLCVREVYSDETFGPIYTVFSGTSERLPYFKSSPDAGFVKAVEAMLNDDLIMPLWWETLWEKNIYDFKLTPPAAEEILAWDLPYRNPGPKNFGKGGTLFHRKDGKAVLVWKFGLAAISADEGETWSRPVRLPTLRTRMQMVHAQRTEDGRYALLFDPDSGTASGEHRYPLVAITSDDGISFDDMAVVHGEVPDQRYEGKSKEIGPSYVRGIFEGQGDPPGDDMWVSYSVNKETIWVARVPVPIRTSVDQPVNDRFDDMDPDGPVVDWNIYSPVWAMVRLVPDHIGSTNLNLELRDRDPTDYARATRVFPQAKQVTATFNLMAEQTDRGRLEVVIESGRGARTARLFLADDGIIWVRNDENAIALAAYKAHDWMKITIDLDATRRTYTIVARTVDGEFTSPPLATPDGPATVERIVFRTGERRLLGRVRERNTGDLPGTDEPVPEAVYHIDNVRIN